jgi:signal transduction histidine kinase
VLVVARWRRGASGQRAYEREREQRALDIHDNIVQGLAEAQMAFDVGRPEQAREAVERTLGQARRIVTELMGKPMPGDLRRATSADRLPER